jgi:hypothetical protein
MPPPIVPAPITAAVPSVGASARTGNGQVALGECCSRSQQAQGRTKMATNLKQSIFTIHKTYLVYFF